MIIMAILIFVVLLLLLGGVVISSGLLAVIGVVFLFYCLVSMSHMTKTGFQDRRKTKAQEQQLDILKQLAKKEGIELPEEPIPWHQKEVSLSSLPSLPKRKAGDKYPWETSN